MNNLSTSKGQLTLRTRTKIKKLNHFNLIERRHVQYKHRRQIGTRLLEVLAVLASKLPASGKSTLRTYQAMGRRKQRSKRQIAT